MYINTCTHMEAVRVRLSQKLCSEMEGNKKEFANDARHQFDGRVCDL